MSHVLDSQGTETPAIAEIAGYEQRVEALSPADRAKWEMTGELPPATNSDAVETADMPASSPGVSEGSDEPESGAAPDPAIEEQPRTGETPQEKSERKKRNDYARYVREKTRADMLERQLAELRAAPAPATPAPKPDVKAEAPKERPKRPRLTDYQDGDQYEAAMDQYETAKEAWDAARQEERLGRVKQETQGQFSQAKLNEKFAAARKVHPDYDAVAFSDKIPASWALIHVLDGMEDGAELRYQLGKDLKAATALANLTYFEGEKPFQNYADFQKWIKADPDRAMAFGETLATAKAELLRFAKSKAAPTTTKPMPKPTAEVAVEPRGAPVSDELDDAIKRGDQDAFERIANAREVAARRR